eukprot:TRINITY_DN323_c7_g1_i1.p1 TRINITY_DN323_c7_g1~~TRINITY_DN323_c7_g1_i1.p1  ORF type:complete len:405 (+),score=88.19 TRINITY_DN323_c7_g1_i1:49-1215(+)
MSFSAGENADLNQYWFSKPTIEAIVNEIQAQSKLGAAFLSTPSLYFSLTDDDLKAKSKVFEFDKQWEQDPGFVFYDYNNPEAINIALFGQFDMVVIDPPFITEECWEKYAKTARLLLCPGGKIISTTLVENEGIMHTLLGCKPVKFQPSIPNLVYQYNTYCSFSPTQFLDEINPEIAISDADPAKQIQRDMLESREQFISMAQNRSGRATEAIIPLDRVRKNTWDKVPEGMTEFPEGGLTTASPKDYGEEYNKLLDLRGKVGDVSKLIDSAVKPIDKFWRINEGIEKHASEPAKVEKLQADLEAAKQLHSDQLEALRGFKDVFPTEGEDSVGRFIDDALKLLSVDTSIKKDQFQKIAPDVQMKFKSPLFNKQKAMLAELKELKKNFGK